MFFLFGLWRGNNIICKAWSHLKIYEKAAFLVTFAQ